MRALIRLAVALPFGLLVILFAVSNRAVVTVTLDPLPGAIDIALSFLVMGVGILGFLFGGLVVWLGQGRHRRLARDARRRLDALSAELGAMKSATKPKADPDAPPPGTSLIAH